MAYINEINPNKVKHGLSKSRFYKIWGSMKARCLNEKHIHYDNYGGRGIIVCNKWLEFEGFMEDMYNGYLKHCEEFGEGNTSIDRINSDGVYELNNCRWATNKEQQRNLKSNIKFYIYEKEYTVWEASEEFSISEFTIRSRLREGKTNDDIIKQKEDLTLDKQSNIKGVIYNPTSNRWHVKGTKNGKNDTYIKSFKLLDEAIKFKEKWDKGEIVEQDLKIRDNNTSGLIGIKQKSNGKWKATITVDNKTYIKTFSTKEESIEWRNNIKINNK